MDVSSFSSTFTVRPLTAADVDRVYALCAGNPLYYHWCPPAVTRAGILEDLQALPPGKTLADKYYVGYFRGETLIAVMDFIHGYPEPNIAFIGFFMTDASTQGKGLGSAIIGALSRYLTGQGYASIRLGWVRGNPQAEHFWRKNGFVPIGASRYNPAYQVVVAEKILSPALDKSNT